MVAQLLVYPIGRAWEKLPRWRVSLGALTFDVNPGKFTIKEHALIVIVSIYCRTISTYLTNGLIVCQPQYERRLCHRIFGSYHKSSLLEQRLWCRFLLPVSPDYTNAWVLHYFHSALRSSADNTNRFGLAGLARRWLVYPGALIWPSTLASTVLFRALHEPQDRTPANGWVMTRYKFFAYFTVFAFVIFWFPDFVWTSLSAFAFITWLVPHNQKVNAIFGVSYKNTYPLSLK